MTAQSKLFIDQVIFVKYRTIYLKSTHAAVDMKHFYLWIMFEAF